MKFKDLKAALSREGAKDVYLLEGEDGWLLSSAERLVRASLNLSCEELNSVQFFGDETPFSEIWNALQVLPFLSEKRLVTVREWYPKAAEISELAKFCASPAEGTVLVISNRKPSADLCKKLACEVVDCGKESEDVVERWTAALCRNFGLTMDYDAVAALCAFCLYDMTRIVSELKKLADFSGGRKVTRWDVEENVSKDAEYQVYELTDSIQKRDGRSMAILEELLGKNDAGYLVLVIGALFANFSRMYAVKTAGLSAAELAKKLKVKEYAVKMSAKNGARFSAEQVARAMEMINDTEYRFKSGALAADIAVRQIVLKLLTL